uniref:NR LBD domain-containing protein n=1 Tax=Strigamia maritima TaxID=126957 RepID=T1JEZ0_STRMM
MGMRADSVQSERKPLDSRERMPSGITGSTQKIYIRKDLRSPLAATPTFVSDKVATDGDVLEKALGLIDAGLISGNSSSSGNTGRSESADVASPHCYAGLMASLVTSPADLSTLASVVTTLATMGKKGELDAGAAELQRMVLNGETAATVVKTEKSLISKAFDTMARAVQSQSPMLHDGQNRSQEHMPVNICSNENESLFEIDGPLLLDSHIPFHLTTPTPMPAYLNVHYICESASRLLFLSVHWARSIPAFQLLSPEVQILLVRGCWSELFTLGLSQCSQVMSLTSILSAILNQLQSNVQQDKVSVQRVKQVTEHICKLQDYVNMMLRLQVDEHEYAYLKAIVLFSPDHPSLPGSRQVEKFQDKAHQELPTLRSLLPNIMEDLFFAGLIGNVQIDSVIPYILRMETSDYSNNSSGTSASGNEAVDMTLNQSNGRSDSSRSSSP